MNIIYEQIKKSLDMEKERMELRVKTLAKIYELMNEIKTVIEKEPDREGDFGEFLNKIYSELELGDIVIEMDQFFEKYGH